ncbi:uncharacterized protein METZ01_LOCUS369257, partial [marine metagenome]
MFNELNALPSWCPRTFLMPQPICFGSGTPRGPTTTEVYDALHFVVPFLNFRMAIGK